MTRRWSRWRRPGPVSAPRTELVAAAVAGASIGAVAEYLLDPARGRARRATLRARSRAAVVRPARRARRATVQKVTYLGGKVRGVPHRLTRPGPPADDRTLVDRIRSQVLGSPDAPGSPVNVDAVDGVVTLRGQIDDNDQIRRLVDAVGKVSGVRRVENLLHPPGTTAPNVEGLQRPGE